jgi:ubiquinone/menaquinone biosynthesis C-methylase UbiE
MTLPAWWMALVRFGFRLLYQELAWTYNLVSWIVSLGEWRSWQLAALPFIQGPRVLEVGHGPGHMLLALQNGRYQVTGLDLSPQMGRLAQRRTQRTVPLVRGAVQTLPFAPASFDTVLATFPTDYIIAPETLASIHRVLTSNGRLVIVPEGHLTGGRTLHRLIAWLFVITGQQASTETPANHPDTAWYTLWEPFQQAFTAAGFHTTIHPIRLPRSGVTLLVAHKNNNPPPPIDEQFSI